MENHIAVFKGKKVRRTIYRGEWFFSVIDIVEALTDSANSRDYWFKMKHRVKTDEGLELSTVCRQFKLSEAKARKISAWL